jgi:hypothetical protein
VRALLVLLLVLGALLVIADRVGVSVAEDQVAGQVAAEGGLAGPPVVDIEGFPFLTQAVSGRYEQVRVRLSAADLGQPEGTTADVSLRGVQVPLSAALSGSVREVPVERIDGSATLSYDLLAAQLGGDTRLERDGDGLRISRTVELLGQQLPLTASGQVTLEGSDLVVDVDDAAGAGIELPGFLVDQANDLLDLRYTVPPLPFGLQLTDVTPGDDGVLVDLQATDAVLPGG